MFDNGEAMFDDGEAMFDDREAMFEDEEAMFDDREAMFEDREAMFDDREAMLKSLWWGGGGGWVPVHRLVTATVRFGCDNFLEAIASLGLLFSLGHSVSHSVTILQFLQKRWLTTFF